MHRPKKRLFRKKYGLAFEQIAVHLLAFTVITPLLLLFPRALYANTMGAARYNSSLRSRLNWSKTKSEHFSALLRPHHSESSYMALLTILEFPDPRLRTRAKPVATVDSRIQRLVDDMFETMYEAPGIGLAASQVDVHERVIVIDLSEDRTDPRVFINPEITIVDDTLGHYDEGCLSVPGFYETVQRPQVVEVSALDREGKPFTETLDGLMGICLQHEIDHLEGKLFVDYLTPLKRQRIRGKLVKEQKRRA
jgi:peptide deformylase